MLIDKIKTDLVEHIKSGDKSKISITRLLIAALKDKEISLRNSQESNELISDSIVMEIINKMIKQRTLAIKTYMDAGREDLANKEKKESELLAIYLPTQLSNIELEKAIDKIINKIEANSLRDMSKVMKTLKNEFSGRCDFQIASELVKNKLENIQ